MREVRAVIERDEFGCELWLGERTRDGYGKAGTKLAHRARWERIVGRIPDGMYLDHLCRRRHCVAIHHLELVNQSDNERRKLWRNRLRTHCRAGHDLVLQSVITPEGGRVCRQCNRDNAGQSS